MDTLRFAESVVWKAALEHAVLSTGSCKHTRTHMYSRGHVTLALNHVTLALNHLFLVFGVLDTVARFREAKKNHRHFFILCIIPCARLYQPVRVRQDINLSS